MPAVSPAASTARPTGSNRTVRDIWKTVSPRYVCTRLTAALPLLVRWTTGSGTNSATWPAVTPKPDDCRCTNVIARSTSDRSVEAAPAAATTAGDPVRALVRLRDGLGGATKPAGDAAAERFRESSSREAAMGISSLVKRTRSSAGGGASGKAATHAATPIARAMSAVYASSMTRSPGVW
jgi:hypothetical protein